MKKIRFCKKCNIFTLSETCSKGHKTTILEPPKYSSADRYGEYRRKSKKTELEKKGLI